MNPAEENQLTASPLHIVLPHPLGPDLQRHDLPFPIRIHIHRLLTPKLPLIPPLIPMKRPPHAHTLHSLPLPHRPAHHVHPPGREHIVPRLDREEVSPQGQVGEVEGIASAEEGGARVVQVVEGCGGCGGEGARVREDRGGRRDVQGEVEG